MLTITYLQTYTKIYPLILGINVRGKDLRKQLVVCRIEIVVVSIVV